jgi:hypothetical protein
MTQPPAADATKDEKGAAEASTTHTPRLTASTFALFFFPLRLFFLLSVLQPGQEEKNNRKGLTVPLHSCSQIEEILGVLFGLWIHKDTLRSVA